MMQPGETTDALFGTRAYTEGARYQLPRKIPLRIEPKTYFGAHLPTFALYIHVAKILRGLHALNRS